MNPIQLSQQLEKTLVNYLTTTFDVDRDGHEPALAKFIQQNLQRKRTLFAGPYLELTPPYQTGQSLHDLANEGIISPHLLQMACFQAGDPIPVDAPLYTHQEAAIRQLATGQNVVVSSGTGSGKTEAFLIPLLNDLIKDSTPGVRAVLVYPLNALVNDQLDRLRRLLKGTNITFGRYTSELERKADTAKKEMQTEWENSDELRGLFAEYPLSNEIISRDDIQSGDVTKLPQILITNYAMLEYLLLRPQDSPLFKHGSWKFIVLDEAHTYAGAQGIEVGMLVRRLKQRLGHNLQCIATSATLSSDKDKQEAITFAEALFGEPFTEPNIILGEPNTDYEVPAVIRRPPASMYLHPSFDDLIADVRHAEWSTVVDVALRMDEIGLITADELSWADNKTTPQFLYEVLGANDRLLQLRHMMVSQHAPIEVETVAAEIFPELSATDQSKALYHLVELASMARPGREKPPLLPARYHLFVRPPQGIWVCLNPTCPDKKQHDKTVWSKLFAAPRECCDACDAPVYPVIVCRTCGQTYLRLHKVGRKYQAITAENEDDPKCYATWRLIQENIGLADEPEGDEEEEDEMLAKVGEPILTQKEIQLCLHCQQEINKVGRCGCKGPSERVVTLHLLQEVKVKKRGKVEDTITTDVDHLNECGRCHSKALKNTEIATDITLNGLTPLAVLTEDLYRHLPASSKPKIQKKPGNGRKLLSFYDSRQGAARFAASMQTTVNEQAYRRLILQAVKQNSTPSYWPALRKICRTAAGLAIDQRIAHNDPHIFNTTANSKRLSGDEQEQVEEYLAIQLLAEITTGMRSRQSLEALGLLAVQYFEPGAEPDFASLAEQLKLTESATRCLVEYLLDDLRRKKIVKLPEGTVYDAPAFGRNNREWFLVRGATQSSQEHSWLGQTARYRRRRLVQKLLRETRPCDDSEVETILNTVLTWLIDKSDLLYASPRGGYQLRWDRLFFQVNASLYRCTNCQRLTYRGNQLPCPHHGCYSPVDPIDHTALDDKDFYYANLTQDHVPLRIEEHTAQLTPKKGRDYQSKFKEGDINMLSCSTTFEMGIDLGDLQAVVMNNIPPTVANYKQRSGRAGRRTSGTAFILTWASNRPHDQAYFRNPAEIISGRVRIPYIDIHNKIIAQRHINAILVSHFFRHCQDTKGHFHNKVGPFFDDQAVDGSYYVLLDDWWQSNQAQLTEQIQAYLPMIGTSLTATAALDSFYRDMQEKGDGTYQRRAKHFKDNQQKLVSELTSLIADGKSAWEQKAVQEQLTHYSRLLDREKKEDIVNFLSGRGVLPSYSFPLYTVELTLPPDKEHSRLLRLQRGLQQAIREYAPGQEVVADKRIWRSESLDFQVKEGHTYHTYHYHICPNCNHLRLAQDPSQELPDLDKPCSVCQAVPKKGKGRLQAHQYIQPDGFRASEDSGKPAGQYVDRPYNVMKSALLPNSDVDIAQRSGLLAIGYAREGQLLYVNEGFQESGFRLCLSCGQQVLSKTTSPCPRCKSTVKREARYSLGFQQVTDTLHLQFSSTAHVSLPPADDPSFWLSLKYALLLGASRALQIERRDIDGVLFPEKPPGKEWQQTIVLYDNVPGGAGHVKRIQDEMLAVVSAALEIVGCDTDETLRCEKSCYRCLQEYANQYEHHLLNRTPLQPFLQALLADLQGEVVGNTKGLYGVVASNQTQWLWEQVGRAQHTVILHAQALSLATPTTSDQTWLDLFQELLQRRVKVQLYLQQLPDISTGSAEALLLAIHLRLLLTKGLVLRQVMEEGEWLAVIDAQGVNARAVQGNGMQALILGADTPPLWTTTHPTAVADIQAQTSQIHGCVVQPDELRQPPNTQVIEIQPDNRSHTEAEYFADFYAKPVRGMTISDRYLDNKEKLLGRVAAHIELAAQGGELTWVKIQTVQNPRGEQQDAVAQLKKKYPIVTIPLASRHHQLSHDRYIEIERTDNSKARLILGKGVDFIRADGSVEHTFLVIQDKL